MAKDIKPWRYERIKKAKTDTLLKAKSWKKNDTVFKGSKQTLCLAEQFTHYNFSWYNFGTLFKDHTGNTLPKLK